MLPPIPGLGPVIVAVFVASLLTTYRLVPLVAMDFVAEQRRKARIRRLWRG